MAATAQQFETERQVGAAVADVIVAGVRAAADARRPYVICSPSGRTPLPVYDALRRRIAERPLPLDHVVVTMLDEYVEELPDGAYRHVDATLPHSCTRWAMTEILDRVNGAGPVTPLTRENLWIPDPRDPGGHEARIQELGGFDLLLLASGASDGHVAFNPQGTARAARTRVVPLSDATRSDNLRTFPTFVSIEDVPRFGVTLGPGSMADLAAQTILMITGPEKREAAVRILGTAGYEESWPATIVHECARAAIYLDRSAATMIDL